MPAACESVLLMGFKPSCREPLETALQGPGRRVLAGDFLPAGDYSTLIDAVRPDVIFCANEPERYRPLIRAMRNGASPVPVVVAGRADVSEWLDALEAGASDYCALPFERTHLVWILETALRSPVRAAAA